MSLTLNILQQVSADIIYVNGTDLSSIYATKEELTNSTGGAITQQDVDDSLAPLILKDIGYNSTLTSHISILGTHATDIANQATSIAINTTGIATLNTKQLDNLML